MSLSPDPTRSFSKSAQYPTSMPSGSRSTIIIDDNKPAPDKMDSLMTSGGFVLVPPRYCITLESDSTRQ